MNNEQEKLFYLFVSSELVEYSYIDFNDTNTKSTVHDYKK